MDKYFSGFKSIEEIKEYLISLLEEKMRNQKIPRMGKNITKVIQKNGCNTLNSLPFMCFRCYI